MLTDEQKPPPAPPVPVCEHLTLVTCKTCGKTPEQRAEERR